MQELPPTAKMLNKFGETNQLFQAREMMYKTKNHSAAFRVRDALKKINFLGRGGECGLHPPQ